MTPRARSAALLLVTAVAAALPACSPADAPSAPVRAPASGDGEPPSPDAAPLDVRAFLPFRTGTAALDDALRARRPAMVLFVADG